MYYYAEVLPDSERPGGKFPVTARVWDASILWHKGATTTEVLDQGRRQEVFECLVTHVSHGGNRPLLDRHCRYWRPVLPHSADPSSSTTHHASAPSHPAKSPGSYPSSSSSHSHSSSLNQPPSSPVPQNSSQRRSSHSQHRRPSGTELFPAIQGGAADVYYPAQVGADLYSAAHAASAPSYVLDSRASAAHPYAASFPSRAGHDPRAMAAYSPPTHTRTNGHSHAQTFASAPGEQARLFHV